MRTLKEQIRELKEKLLSDNSSRPKDSTPTKKITLNKNKKKTVAAFFEKAMRDTGVKKFEDDLDTVTVGKPKRKPKVPIRRKGRLSRSNVGDSDKSSHDQLVAAENGSSGKGKKPDKPAKNKNKKYKSTEKKRRSRQQMFANAMSGRAVTNSAQKSTNVSKKVVKTPAKRNAKAVPIVPTVPIEDKYLQNLRLAETYDEVNPLVENWSTLGIPTQLKSTSATVTNVEVTIGIDFGTSYTKVAVRVNDDVFYVNFGENADLLESYILPSALYVEKNNSCTIFKPSNYSASHGGLKSTFIGSQQIPEVKQATRVYIALVMRFIRAWLYSNPVTNNLLTNKRIVWNVNMGCPTGSSDSDSVVENALHDLTAQAWVLSTVSNLLLDHVTSCDISSSLLYKNYSLNEIFVVPEFAAQIAGYINSPDMSQELHILCDIGAGTVDISIFNVLDHEPGNAMHEAEMRLSIFSSRVLIKGTHVLMSNRLVNSGKNILSWDDARGIPDLQSMTEQFGCEKACVEAVDNAISQAIFDEIKRQLIYVKEDRDPRAEAWKRGRKLRLFLCGGGASCSVYNRVISRLEKFGVQLFDEQEIGMNLSRLSPNLKSKSGLDRLSVAAGLAQHLDDISIRKPDEIENFTIEESGLLNRDSNNIYYR